MEPGAGGRPRAAAASSSAAQIVPESLWTAVASKRRGAVEVEGLPIVLAAVLRLPTADAQQSGVIVPQVPADSLLAQQSVALKPAFKPGPPPDTVAHPVSEDAA